MAHWKKMLLAAGLAAMVASAGAAEVTTVLPAAHKSFSCETCHAGAEGNMPKNETCLKCHGPMKDLVAKTSGYALNPHDSPHWGESVPCGTCHRQHAQPKVYCEACHRNQNYKAR